jgi:hypothetical protein
MVFLPLDSVAATYNAMRLLPGEQGGSIEPGQNVRRQLDKGETGRLGKRGEEKPRKQHQAIELGQSMATYVWIPAMQRY